MGRGASSSIESGRSLSREGEGRSHLFIIRGESAEIWGRPSSKGEGKSWGWVVARVAGWHRAVITAQGSPELSAPASGQAAQPSPASLSAAFVLFWRQPISFLSRDCMQEAPRANLKRGMDYQC